MNAPASIPSHGALLTRGQVQLVESAARGQTCVEMAAALGIRPNTAAMGLQRARERLGARNTTHLVALAIARGLVDLAHLRAIADAADALGIGARRG